jgi:uncharacterized protein involved in exopolysaccharide biosynthesis
MLRQRYPEPVAEETTDARLNELSPKALLVRIWRQSKRNGIAIAAARAELHEVEKRMTDAFDALDEKVEQDISDDTLAKEAYADLKAQLDAQTQIAVDAVNQSSLDKAAKDQALADLEAGKARAQAAADKLAGSSPIAPTDPPA